MVRPSANDTSAGGASWPDIAARVVRRLVAPVAILVALSMAQMAHAATIPADADAHVDFADPAANFGSAPLLKVAAPSSSGTGGARALLEFPAIPAGATSVRLRVFATAASSGPMLVRAIEQACGWDYVTVTWNTRPDQSAVLATRPSVAAGWNEFSLPATSVPGAGGTACFYVTKGGGGAVSLHSLSQAHPAQLVVGGAPASPSPRPLSRPPSGTVQRTGIVMSPKGSDANPCTQAAPCRTLRRASSLLAPGRTLYARGGTYPASSGNASEDWLAPNGTKAAPVTFRNYPGETPVFDGGATGCSTACADDGSGEFLIVRGSYQVFHGLTVQHFNNRWGNGAITPIGSSAHHLTFEYMTFRDNGHDQSDHDIYPGAGPVRDLTIRYSSFIGGTGGGIHMYHATNTRGARIYGNVFREKFWGVIVCDGADRIRIFDNAFYRNSTPPTFNPPAASVQTSCGSVPAKTVIVRDNVSYSVALGLQKGSAVNVVEGHNTWSRPVGPSG
jgi:hypothetical protein